MRNALILLAGGSGKRMNSLIPKQFLKIGNTNLIDYFLNNLDINLFDIIVIAVKNDHKKKYLKFIKKKFSHLNIHYSTSGETRQITTKKALEFLRKYTPINVLIHDSARPLVSNSLIKKITKSLEKNFSCIPFVSYSDYIKYKKNIIINNNEIMNIQTPQGFNFKKIYKAHMLSKSNKSKDDSSIFELIGEKSNMIIGEKTNLKITTKEDIKYFKNIRTKDYRSGIGYDIHKIDFNSKKKLILCGVTIPNYPPLIGHSDADVGYHAVCDSIFGSLSMNDIGNHFSDKNKKWKNANSKIFINYCAKKLIERGYKIVNLDINFICEKPNINKLSHLMKKNLSSNLKITTGRISIKATTNEKIGLIGKGEGIAAESIVQIVNV